MGISQLEPSNTYYAISPSNINLTDNEQEPPKIPPRMKKQGPELPEKPAHLRLTNLTKKVTLQSSQKHFVSETFCNFPPSDVSNQGITLTRKPPSDREILVAATKGTRDRPAEKRQREPAKLLASLGPPADDTSRIPTQLSSPSYMRKNNSENKRHYKPQLNKSNTRHPVVLIPRSQLDTRNIQQFWKSYPVSYAVWVQNAGSGDAQVTSRLVKKAFSPNGGSTVELHPNIVRALRKSHKEQTDTKDFVNNIKSSPSASAVTVKQRSSSVTRSGSLTSHDSISSDSGNETFPKSVLKKHRRESNPAFHDKKNIDQKKNVTFNAFATVQLMDE